MNKNEAAKLSRKGVRLRRVTKFDKLPEEAKQEIAMVVERIRERSMTQAKAYEIIKERVRAIGAKESDLPSFNSFNRYVREELGLSLRPGVAPIESASDIVFTNLTREKLMSALGASGYISLEAFIRTLTATQTQSQPDRIRPGHE